MPTKIQSLKALALASLAYLPRMVYSYGNENAVKLFPREAARGTTLIPYYTPGALVKKDQVRIGWEVDDIELPELGQLVELLYGEDLRLFPENTDPFVTKIEFTPAPNRAILVLEQYTMHPLQDGGILREVVCKGSPSEINRVVLDMVGNGQRVQTFNNWLAKFSKNEEEDLVVVTSDNMRGCASRERKAFMVNSVTIGGTLTTLDVTPIEWSTVSQRMSVEFGRLSATSLANRDLADAVLGARDETSTTAMVKRTNTPNDDGVDHDGLIKIHPNITPRLLLYPLPNVSPTIDLNLPFHIPFLPQEDGQNSPQPAPPLAVTCVNCGLSGVMGYYGKLDVDLEVTTILKLDQAYIIVNVTEDLIARLNLEVATSDKPFTYSFQQSIFPALGSQAGIVLASFGVTGVIEIRPYFDYAIGGSIEVGAPRTNVTFGGQLRVKKGATLRWDLVDKKSSQSGWDVEVTNFPMTINQADTGKYSLGLNISSIPSILMNLEVGSALGKAPAQVGAKLAMILPRIYSKSTLMKDVTAKCATPGPSDYTYFPYGISFESGLYTGLIGELFATVNLDFGVDKVTLNANAMYQHTIWEYTRPFKNNCFLFGNSKTGQGVLRNTSSPDAVGDMVFDVKKIEAKFKETGKIPPEVDVKKLAEVKNLPAELKVALSKPGEYGTELNLNVTSTTSEGNSWVILNGSESPWTIAILAFGSAFF